MLIFSPYPPPDAPKRRRQRRLFALLLSIDFKSAVFKIFFKACIKVNLKSLNKLAKTLIFMYNHNVLYLSLSSKNYATYKYCSVLGFENNSLLQEPDIFSTEEPNVELALIFLLLPL